MSSAQNMSQPQDVELIVEKDIQIPLRDGSKLVADVFRPDVGDEPVPVIFNIGPYQKDKLWVPPPSLEEDPNEYMNWEVANPLWWCPRGYALVRVDSRGSGKSPGKIELNSMQEAIDGYDCIEWVAQQQWCTGNVGMLGVSYLASDQWRIAGLKPPSLKAIIPWEGWGDNYRDQAYHGGILATGFWSNWHTVNMATHLLGMPRSYNPDSFNSTLMYDIMRNDLDNPWWRMNSAQWENIEVPLFSAGNWGGVNIHLRGNVEGFVNAASEHKKLRVHTGTHYHPFHSEEGRIDQLRFMDYWLKGIDTGIMDEPPVKLEIRTGGQMTPYEFRFEDDWPIPRTQWTKLYLKAEGEATEEGDTIVGPMVWDSPDDAGQVTYRASAPSRPGPSPRGISFESPPLDEDTEITGPLVLNLWISSTSEDADIFATIRNIDADGNDVCEIGQQGQAIPSVTKGWLRASHRKLDPERSKPYRPYHAHDERWWLEDDEPVECQVEIWPTSMLFKAGHRIRLDITPIDGLGIGPQVMAGVPLEHSHFHADYNWHANNTVYTGADKQSYLLLPVIPPKE